MKSSQLLFHRSPSGHPITCAALWIAFSALTAFAQTTPHPNPQKAPSAETDEIPPPTPPLVATPAKSTRFTIAVSQTTDVPPAGAAGLKPAKSTGEAGAPQTVEAWKDAQGNVRIVVGYFSGGSSEGYLMGERFAILTTSDPTRAQVVANPSGSDAILSFFTKDFPGTQWIKIGDYVGVEKTQSGPCHAFHRPAQPLPEFVDGRPPAGFDPLDHTEFHALISVKDKHPTQVRIGSRILRFSAPEAWPGTLTFPPLFQSAAEDFQRQVQTLDALRRQSK